MANTEIDILDIDNKIKSFFNDESKKMPFYLNRLSEMERTSNTNIPRYRKILIDKDINILKEKIEKTQSNKELNFYISETI